jgi:hypothetical protein
LWFVFLYSKADVPEANEFVKTIVQIAPGMGIDLKATSIRKELAEGTGKGIHFCKELQKYVSSAPDMVVTILPRNEYDLLFNNILQIDSDNYFNCFWLSLVPWYMPKSKSCCFVKMLSIVKWLLKEL